MRFVPLVVLAGCGFNVSVVPTDTPPVFDDSGREIRQWDLDTATDFAAGTATDMTIDPRGSLTPHGYIYGALLARGVQGTKLWTNTDADWAKIATVAPMGYGLWTGNDLSTAGDLRFVGITNPTSMVSVWMEGEVWINAPGEMIRVAGDDTAFVYVAADRESFTKVAHQSTGTVTVATSGWYPIRVGWADGNGTGDLDLEITDPVGGGLGGPRHDRFRTAASSLRGTFRNVYYREVHGGGIGGAPPVMTIQETPLHAATTFDPPLPGSVTTATIPFDWSARWTGQFYAAAAGTYTVQVESNDGSRIVLGTAAPAAQKFARDDKGAVVTVATASLEVGWNDLIVDFNHVDGTPAFAVRVTAAPAEDAALVGNAIPVDRLRPVQPRSDRLITRSSVSQGLAVQDDANVYVDRNVRIDAHASELVSFVEVTARVQTTRINQLTYRLTAPSTTTQIRDDLVEAPDGNQVGSFIIYGVWDLGAAAAANGTWRFGVADNSTAGGGNTTTYHEAHVTMHTRGGPAQIATASAWTSPVIENATAVSLIDHVTWKERVPAGASVNVRMRTCAQADCSDGTFSAPIANGEAPVLTPHRYLQLRVEMTSDGTREPEVEAIAVQYRTDPK